jgi:hypothetical protein
LSLLKPTLGELVDRLTILDLKISNGSNCSKPVAHFVEEHSLLQDYGLKTFGNNAPGKNYKRLYTINATLWELEDKIRILFKTRPNELSTIVSVSKRIHHLNDERAKVIHELNVSGGFKGEEKSYEGLYNESKNEIVAAK